MLDGFLLCYYWFIQYVSRGCFLLLSWYRWSFLLGFLGLYLFYSRGRWGSTCRWGFWLGGHLAAWTLGVLLLLDFVFVFFVWLYHHIGCLLCLGNVFALNLLFFVYFMRDFLSLLYIFLLLVGLRFIGFDWIFTILLLYFLIELLNHIVNIF